MVINHRSLKFVQLMLNAASVVLVGFLKIFYQQSAALLIFCEHILNRLFMAYEIPYKILQVR